MLFCIRVQFYIVIVFIISVQDSKILSQLVSIESQLDKLYANPEPELVGDETRFIAAFSDLADRELVITISWAKQVPGKCGNIMKSNFNCHSNNYKFNVRIDWCFNIHVLIFWLFITYNYMFLRHFVHTCILMYLFITYRFLCPVTEWPDEPSTALMARDSLSESCVQVMSIQWLSQVCRGSADECGRVQNMQLQSRAGQPHSQTSQEIHKHGCHQRGIPHP